MPGFPARTKLSKGNPNATPANAEHLAPYRFTSERASALARDRWLLARTPFKGQWAKVYEGIRSELAEKYGSYGPQYRLLCEMVASTWTHIRRAEGEGLKVSTPEYTRAMELLRRLIDQGQRYTEARKSEIITNEVNSAVKETLLIVESHLQDQPELFRTIVLEVRDRVMA